MPDRSVVRGSRFHPSLHPRTSSSTGPFRLFGCSGPIRRPSSSVVPVQFPVPIPAAGSGQFPGSAASAGVIQLLLEASPWSSRPMTPPLSVNPLASPRLYSPSTPPWSFSLRTPPGPSCPSSSASVKHRFASAQTSGSLAAHRPSTLSAPPGYTFPPASPSSSLPPSSPPVC